MNTRKVRRFLGILILVISLAILLWGVWPFEELTRTMPIQPADIQLPTSEGLRWNSGEWLDPEV